MKKILTFGIFDYFHLGHLRLFQQCKQYAPYLIVAVQDDPYVHDFKPDVDLLYSIQERVEMLSALRIVDEVVVYDVINEKTLESIDFDIIALGEDHFGERFDLAQEWCRRHSKSVVRLKRTPGISSSDIKTSLKTDCPQVRSLMIMSTAMEGRMDEAIIEARKLGIRTIACIGREDDAGLVNADVCYCTGSEDVDALMRVARQEKIDGVLGVWDKSVLPAAQIAGELHLPGNTPQSMETLLDKGRFRDLQEDVGVFCPAHVTVSSDEGLEEKCRDLRYPIIVKPCLCSSSFGQTVLEDDSHLIEAFRKAAASSRNGNVCIEEFVKQDSLRILEADVFLYEGTIFWDGLRWCDRFLEAPLRPVLDSYPCELSEEQEREFRIAVTRVLKAAGVSLGEYNIEGFFTENGQYFIIEINPRPAGYYNQQDVELFSGVNFAKLLVTTAVGDRSYYEEMKTFPRKSRYMLSYAVFSFKSGIYDHLYIDPALRPALLTFRAFPDVRPGSFIEDIHADNRPVGTVIFAFPTREKRDEAHRNIRDLVYVVLRDEL